MMLIFYNRVVRRESSGRSSGVRPVSDGFTLKQVGLYKNCLGARAKSSSLATADT